MTNFEQPLDDNQPLDAELEEILSEIELETDTYNWEEIASDDGHFELYEDDGQPDEYTEWQDVYDGDDWDHGQYDDDYYDGGVDY